MHSGLQTWEYGGHALFPTRRPQIRPRHPGLAAGLLDRQQFQVLTFIFSLIAVALGLWLGPDLTGWALIAVAIGLVFVAELFNTAIEYLVRMFTTEYHELAEKLLDISAGAVLFASITSIAIAIFVYVPLLGRHH